MKDIKRTVSRTDWRADSPEAANRHDPAPTHGADAQFPRDDNPVASSGSYPRTERSSLRDERGSGARMRADSASPPTSGQRATNQRPADVICAGMYRACSTWQYEVAAHLIEQHSSHARLGYLTGEHYAERRRSQQAHPQQTSTSSWNVFKSHEGHECFAEVLADGQAIALYAYRDVRDVVYSLMHKRKLSFEGLLRQGMLHQILANDRFWMRQPGLLVQRYEQILANPTRAVIEIANHLGFGVNEPDAKQIADEYSLESNLARTHALKERLKQAGVDLNDHANAQICDSTSLLHWNHLRKGGSGSWAEEATPPQRYVLDRMYGAWLRQHGYPDTNPVSVSGHAPSAISIADRLRIEIDMRTGYLAWLIRAVAHKYPKTVSRLKRLMGSRPKAQAGAKVWADPSQAEDRRGKD